MKCQAAVATKKKEPANRILGRAPTLPRGLLFVFVLARSERPNEIIPRRVFPAQQNAERWLRALGRCKISRIFRSFIGSKLSSGSRSKWSQSPWPWNRQTNSTWDKSQFPNLLIFLLSRRQMGFSLIDRSNFKNFQINNENKMRRQNNGLATGNPYAGSGTVSEGTSSTRKDRSISMTCLSVVLVGSLLFAHVKITVFGTPSGSATILFMVCKIFSLYRP